MLLNFFILLSLSSITPSLVLPVSAPFPVFPHPILLSPAPLKILTQPVLIFLLFPTSLPSSPSHSAIPFLFNLSLTSMKVGLCWWQTMLGCRETGMEAKTRNAREMVKMGFFFKKPVFPLSGSSKRNHLTALSVYPERKIVSWRSDIHYGKILL